MGLPNWDRDHIPADHWFIRWFDKYIVEPTHLNRWFPSPSGWRVFGIQIGFWENNWEDEFCLLRVEGPGIGRKMWKNALFSFYFHLPFCLSIHLKLPIKFAGERWGYVLQAQIGWKVTGNLSATLRVQPDLVDDYNTETQHWRAKGLDEGWV